MPDLRIAMIGTGKIALANHLPGVAISRRARVVALCDSDARTLDEASKQSGITKTFSDYQKVMDDPDIDAVIIATPNITHPAMTLAAVKAKKHVLCEKPLALNVATATEMYLAAERAGVRHMTAFTYRFVPAMRYMEYLVKSGAVGRPWHFRAQRFQDWADKPLGWRQVKSMAGSGELGDMLSHRIDYGHLLLGPIERLVAQVRNFTPMRQTQPNDTDDWVGMLAHYEADVTGVLESTKLATGRGEGYGGRDDVEINGTEGSIVYSTQSPLELRVAKIGDHDVKIVPVPLSYQVWPGSPRKADEGDPRVTFRYDQAYEFIDAILSERPCRPSLVAGVQAQAVMDAALESSEKKSWIDVKYPV